MPQPDALVIGAGPAGLMAAEELAKTGASDKYQLYGEIGLEYGNERKHACIYNLGGYTS